MNDFFDELCGNFDWTSFVLILFDWFRLQAGRWVDLNFLGGRSFLCITILFPFDVLMFLTVLFQQQSLVQKESSQLLIILLLLFFVFLLWNDGWLDLSGSGWRSIRICLQLRLPNAT